MLGVSSRVLQWHLLSLLPSLKTCIEMVSSRLRKLCLAMLEIKLINFDLKSRSFLFWVQNFIGLVVGGTLVPVFPLFSWE